MPRRSGPIKDASWRWLLTAAVISGLVWIAKTHAETPEPCIDDAMIVFDASGSMSGNKKLGLATSITRIDEVRAALGRALPSTMRSRRIGLITYGPGPYNQCNVEIKLRPVRNAAKAIMSEVNRLVPAGKTPLTSAVEQAATILDYRTKPGVVVVLTDGEETCEGSPCELGKRLKVEADHLVVHVIAYRPENFSWTGEQNAQEAKCLAETNNGLYITADTLEELVAAFKRTLACPMLSNAEARRPGPRSTSP